jgi:hypothetical protein
VSGIEMTEIMRRKGQTVQEKIEIDISGVN